MSKSKKKTRQAKEKESQPSESDEKQSISLPANPPRGNLAMLLISAAAVIGWIVFLFVVAVFG